VTATLNTDVRRWTREEHEHLVEQGFFHPEERCELVEGVLAEMTPQTSRHATGVRFCLIGVPQGSDRVPRFCPPAAIARREPYCLFLDELNACSHEVQKAFYSLIHERRIGEYQLPAGSIVIGAGNRAQDSAIVKPMSSALLNRMV